ncbi:hypothetical protein R2R35_21895 [Anaerocolumna sp. AGMB13020]|uniref:hypothetical protein n=1 Tax=Anaerocolumna sp. AGMB13020 TaxID=3081750 RepID=UPI0029534F2D|nr:hypothetical protein [Anaerocolumna sp. AGMB13020]WOO36413.1 hypothetical protein R2R35_21895 [Anaerocolumna sp. AGMB13020]
MKQKHVSIIGWAAAKRAAFYRKFKMQFPISYIIETKASFYNRLTAAKRAAFYRKFKMQFPISYIIETKACFYNRMGGSKESCLLSEI